MPILRFWEQTNEQILWKLRCTIDSGREQSRTKSCIWRSQPGTIFWCWRCIFRSSRWCRLWWNWSIWRTRTTVSTDRLRWYQSVWRTGTSVSTDRLRWYQSVRRAGASAPTDKHESGIWHASGIRHAAGTAKKEELKDRDSCINPRNSGNGIKAFGSDSDWPWCIWSH